MRHSVLLVTCLCALATGLALLALAQDLTRPPVPADRATGDAANVALVHRFYAAANAVLATGDSAPLAATVAPDLAEHPARFGAVSGRDGLVRALLSLRATFPSLTLVVDDVRAAGGDQVLARVHAEGTGSGAFLGRLVPASLGRWGPLEVWGVEDGRLAERWGGGPDAVTLMPLGQVPFSVDALGPGGRRMTVTRLTAEPGATLPVTNGPAIRVFAVETGALTADVGARTRGPVAVAQGTTAQVTAVLGESVAVAAGDILATAPGADYTLANVGSTTAVAIVVVISNVSGGGSPQSDSAAAASWAVAAMPEALGGVLPSPFGVAARVLASGVELAVPAQPILAVGWMVLPPGATLALPPGDGALLTVVDGGRGDLTPTGGLPTKPLAAGEWEVLPAGVGSTWRAGDDAPAAVLVVAVGREETPASDISARTV